MHGSCILQTQFGTTPEQFRASHSHSEPLQLNQDETNYEDHRGNDPTSTK